MPMLVRVGKTKSSSAAKLVNFLKKTWGKSTRVRPNSSCYKLLSYPQTAAAASATAARAEAAAAPEVPAAAAGTAGAGTEASGKNWPHT